MSVTQLTDFDAYRAMQAQLHQEETAAREAKLIAEGTWMGTLESFEPIKVERLPQADAIGYNLLFIVDEHGVPKRNYVNVYFTPVSGQKGLILPSKLGAQFLTVMGMQEHESYADVLKRAINYPMMLRIGRKEASNGYPAKNTTWALSKVA